MNYPNYQISVVDHLFDIAKNTDRVARQRLSAAIVYKKSIVCTATNEMRSHPFQLRFGCNSDSIYLHAETNVIKKALRELSEEELTKSHLYVMRAKYNDRKELVPALAKPCMGCSRCIATFGINKVFYSTNEGDIKML